MRDPLLVEFFNGLPEDALLGINDLPVDRQGLAHSGRKPKEPPGKAKRRAVLHLFRQQVTARYTETTLARLARSEDPVARRAAVFALGQVGTMDSNETVALALHDLDEEVAKLAAAALWRVWARGESPAEGDALYQAVRVKDYDEAITGLDALIERFPGFAEAYDQRALVQFRAGCYEEAVLDCEATVELNPWHFGALAGMGQCHLRLRRHEEALRAFQSALRVHPRLDGVAAAMRAIENALEDEGR